MIKKTTQPDWQADRPPITLLCAFGQSTSTCFNHNSKWPFGCYLAAWQWFFAGGFREEWNSDRWEEILQVANWQKWVSQTQLAFCWFVFFRIGMICISKKQLCLVKYYPVGTLFLWHCETLLIWSGVFYFFTVLTAFQWRKPFGMYVPSKVKAQICWGVLQSPLLE